MGRGHKKINDTCGWEARLASRRTPRGVLPRCGFSVVAGPGRSKVGKDDDSVCAASSSWPRRAACFSNRASVERGKPDPNLRG